MGSISPSHSFSYLTADPSQRFDQGPSLLLLPHLFEEVFHDLDTSLEKEGVKLIKCEPNYNIWFSDGESFELSTDVARMKLEVEKWEGKDGFSRYLDFLREAHLHYELSVTHVLKKNFTSLFSMARPSFLRHLLTLHPFESIYTRASKYFWTERLRRVFTFGSMYMGMSPFDAPGTYSLLQYTELAEGIWYPEGGFHRIVSALVDIGKRLGVTYHLSSPVSSVTLSPDNRRATGITLSNGETKTADIVLLNADLVYAYNNLLPSSSMAKSLQSRDASCSSISFYWAMNRKIPELCAHNIFLADSYKSSFDDIFKRHQIPREPSFYVNVPSRIDASAAPEGKDGIVVLVPVGHLTDPSSSSSSTEEQNTPQIATSPTATKSDGAKQNQKEQQDWPTMISLARSTILHTIESRTGAENLSSAIVHEHINSPLEWQTLFNLDKGAILGLSHSFFNVLSFRPSTKHAQIEGLYFVGASTHPGTGVPICLAGSKVVGEQILGDLGVDIPWRKGSEKDGKAVEGKVKNIDRVRAPPLSVLFSNLWVKILVVLIALFVEWYTTHNNNDNNDKKGVMSGIAGRYFNQGSWSLLGGANYTRQ